MSRAWWKDAVVYQIYPKSFADANGDGVGDLRGIIRKLPYLQSLGADILWLSPIFASPMIDNGYDISDYTAVNPLFGAMADAEELFAEAKLRNLRVVLDIALNHTSTAHPWFQEAMRGDKRDWYFFKPAGAPFNNWRSIFGGPAWSEAGGAQYLHLFDKTQADLNWDNDAVRAAIYDAMRFWLDKGAGGFRLDVVTVISKPDGLPDVADPDPAPLYRVLADGPRLHQYLREMRREVFAHYDCVAIGEAPGVDPPRAAKLVDPADPMLDLIYHFGFYDMKRGADGDWDRVDFKRILASWDEGIGPRGWNTFVLSNHDLQRIVSRFGDDKRYWRESATMLLALVLTQRATPFLYQGDEIGMTNCAFSSLTELDDVWAKMTYRLAREAGADEADAFAAANAMTRDHARTPFLWSDAGNAGFSEHAPWLRQLDRKDGRDAAAQAKDPQSVLSFARALIALRRSNPLWREGAFEDLAPNHPDVFRFSRTLGDARGVVMLNLRGEEIARPEPSGITALCNYEGEAGETLRPYEAVIEVVA